MEKYKWQWSSILDIDIPTLSFSKQSPSVGSKVTLTCNVKAKPVANKFRFYQGTKEISSGAGKTYEITSVQKEHEAAYICEAENEVKKEKSSAVSLSVHCKIYSHLFVNIKINFKELCSLLSSWRWVGRLGVILIESWSLNWVGSKTMGS